MGMIRAQPPPEVHGIVEAHRRCCRRCGLRGGGEGWPHVLPLIVGMDGDGNGNCNYLREKGWDKGGGERELKDGFVFSCYLI